MLNFEIKLYSLAELPEKSRERAINEHRYFLLDTLQPDYIDGVTDWNDPEKMEMYQDEYDYIQMNDEPVIESIEINEYYFFYNGDLCNVCHYVAGPLTGQTWAIVGGERYLIQEGNTHG